MLLRSIPSKDYFVSVSFLTLFNYVYIGAAKSASLLAVPILSEQDIQRSEA